MIDAYLWGNVERISPEAPVPVVSVTKRENRLGGAANVALNIQSLGAEPLLFSVVGDDEKGRKFKKLLKKSGLWCEGIFIVETRNTTIKSRIISKGQHIARVDEESTDFINNGLEQKIISAIKTSIDSARIDVILFVDYDKGVITPNLFNIVNQAAIQKNIPTAVDPKNRNFHLYNRISLFKPNFSEFIKGTGQQIQKGDLEALKNSAFNFKTKQQIKLIMITLSELGVYMSNGEEEKYFPAEIRYIADVSGAGDTVLSVASLAIAAGISQEIMVKMSNIAGGLVCEMPGVIPVNKNQLMAELETENF